MEKKDANLPKDLPPEALLRPIANDTLRFWVAWLIQRFFLLPVCFFLYRVFNRVRIHNVENFDLVDGQSFLICPNHTSAFDGPISGVYSASSWGRILNPNIHWTVVADPVRMVFRVVQYFCIFMGVIPVDRKAGMEQFCMQDAIRIMKTDRRQVVFGIYPEGTRSKTGRVARRGKFGVGYMHKKTGLPVLPIYHKNIPGMPTIGKTIDIYIGKPMDLSEFESEPDSPLTWKAIANEVVYELQAMERIAYGEEDPSSEEPSSNPKA